MVEFKRVKLKNGLTILHEKREVPVSTIMLAVKYGAAYEDEKEKGVAHAIEHLCFKGTENRTKEQIVDELESVGGMLNAHTSEESTFYHVKIASNFLKIGMDVVFDMVFNASFPESEFEKEMAVIKEEVKMYKDNPLYHSLNEIKKNLYANPFGMNIGGTIKTVSSFNREKILELHKKYYFPANCVLVVVGNNDFNDIIRLAEIFSVDRMGEAPKMSKIKRRIVRSSEKRKNMEQAHICLGVHFPLVGEKERYAAEIFSEILGEGFSARLFKEVRENRGLVYGIKCNYDVAKDYGYFFIWAGTDKSKLKEVEKVSLDVFRKMKDLSEEDFEKAKQRMIGRKKVSFEDSETTAMEILSEELSTRAEDFYKLEENLSKVSIEDVRKIANKKEFARFILSS